MAGQESKITEKPSANTFRANDSLICISNGSVKLVNTDVLFSNLTIKTSTSTPANSTANAKAGTIWYDSNYLYIAVANNTIKRVSLNSF